ncbi:MAG: hypothetical protein ACXVMS_09220 [Flavisolibacter sp.]
MSRKSTPSIGAFHPVLFFMLIYGISLFLAIFVCRTVYFSLNESPSAHSRPQVSVETTIGATALR